MITYEQTYPNLGYKVFLDKKLVGAIKMNGAGWQYVPKGQKTGGEVFKYLVDCKESIEGDSDE